MFKIFRKWSSNETGNTTWQKRSRIKKSNNPNQETPNRPSNLSRAIREQLLPFYQQQRCVTMPCWARTPDMSNISNKVVTDRLWLISNIIGWPWLYLMLYSSQDSVLIHLPGFLFAIICSARRAATLRNPETHTMARRATPHHSGHVPQPLGHRW